MNKFDLHRMSITELETQVDGIVGSIRNRGVSEIWMLVTGEGVLKQHLKKYLKEEYDLESRETHNNSGTITLTME